MLWGGQNWRPSRVERVIETLSTSTRPAKVMTDAGPAFLKGMGNPAGNDSLACEIVAGELAHLIGLRVPEFAIVPLELDIMMDGHGTMNRGPAFVSKALPGATGDGGDIFLSRLRRPQDVAKLVLFDTWIRNHDRYPPDGALHTEENLDNIFFTPVDRKFDLVALDHSHCFVEGELEDDLGAPSVHTDDRICGLFPEFQRFMHEVDVRHAASAIAAVNDTAVKEIIASVPHAWGPRRAMRDVWAEVIVARGRLIADAGMKKLIEQGRLALG